jgi:hypothetical protein
MTLEDLYRHYGMDSRSGNHARELLRQTHWFASSAEFDPRTGDALPLALSAFLTKAGQSRANGTIQDRLYRITEHARPALERLFRSLNESPQREHALLPVRAVRELDASSFMKLCNRPGRNIREKLAGKPYLQAVRRCQSVDLPENRLLRAFLARLAELLELRHDFLNEAENELLPRIRSWLLSEDVRTIGDWENLPPNNTLLAHRDYRRVWDAWCWLRTLDDDIAHDFAQIQVRAKTMRRWIEYAQKYSGGTHLFAEMPVLFDYDCFEIHQWTSELVIKKANRKTPRFVATPEFDEPVCVDLASLHPNYATATTSRRSLNEAFLWQRWKRDDATVDIGLFLSDAAYLHQDASSTSLPGLLFSPSNTGEHSDRAARAFVDNLRRHFKHDDLVWLVPDFLNDFELQLIRRSINARYLNAEPLPRSVAAAFEQVDYSKVGRDGFAVVVIDVIGDKTCVTKLIARSDPDLKRQVPETRGFYWERCPHVILEDGDIEGNSNANRLDYGMATVDSKGKWYKSTPHARPRFVESKALQNDPRIGSFSFCINVKKSPVLGGVRLHVMQQRAGNTPLWRDSIPSLSIQAKDANGIYRRFCLVSRGTTVKPIRGQAVPINVSDTFTLPAGKEFYQFPLFLGENDSETGYSASLKSSAFRLGAETECSLQLTFEYGDDDPYKLIFTPLDGSFPPVLATWPKTEDVIITDAPAPEYPAPMSWEELRRFPDLNRGGTADLTQKIKSTSSNLSMWLGYDNDKAWEKITKSVKGWCRFLVFAIWRDGRSIRDLDCPETCLIAANDLVTTLEHVGKTSPEHGGGVTRRDLMVLLCAMHKDMPSHCVEWINEQVTGEGIRDARAVGFALGDVSMEWQQTAFRILASRPDNLAISVFAYAIWREQHVVERFSISDLRATLKTLSCRLAKVQSPESTCSQKKQKWALQTWGRRTAEPLELLLGLLRTRDSEDPEIKMLLQPHQELTKQLAKQVERVAEIIVQEKIPLFSRVQLNIEKPAGDDTPDLLYALRLYLTGDDGANAIHITSVSDNDNE